MKNIIHTLVRGLNYIIIALILAVVASLSAVYFVSSHFENYRDYFEEFATKTISQPVNIGAISIGSRGLEPVLKLQDVTVFNDAKTKKIFQAKELDIGIGLVESLINRQVKTGMLLVRGSELNLSQDKNGKITLAGIGSGPKKSDGDDSVFAEVASWIFQQSSISFEEITLKFLMANRKLIKLSDLNVKLNNGTLQHNLTIGGELGQKGSPAIFSAKFKLRGDFLNAPGFPLNGEIKLQNWSYDFDVPRVSGNDLPLPVSGDINLLIEDSKVSTKLFRQAMPINKLGARVVWLNDDKGLKLDVSKLKFGDDWLSFEGKGDCLLPAQSADPTVDIKLKYNLSNLAKAKLYYPAKLMPVNAVTWLDQAFANSKLISGSMILKGPLSKFPFDNKEGEFLVDSIIREVDLHYDPEWPLVEKITGKMVFAGRTMTIIADDAEIMGEQTKFIKTVIPDLDLPILYVEGGIDANSAMGLRFVNASPLKDVVGRKLQDIKLSGPMLFSLNMKMPLSDNLKDQETDVEGGIKLRNNIVSSDELSFSVSKVDGDLHFNNGNLVANDVKGELFGRPIKLNIATIDPDGKDPITRVGLAGSAGVYDFEKTFDIGLSQYAQGSLDYSATLDLHTANVSNLFNLSSNLVGVAIKLPKPFAKSEAETYKFDLNCYFGGSNISEVVVNYNDQISAAVALKKGKKALELVAGEIKIGDGKAKVGSSSGLVISGNLDNLDWSVWKKYMNEARQGMGAAGTLLKQISLKISKLDILDRVFNNVSLKASPYDGGWKLALVMPGISGKVYLPKNEKKAIRGNFAKIHIDDDKKNGLNNFKPSDLPALDFKIADFKYGAKSFNNISFVTEKMRDGVKINKINIADSRFKLKASGKWLGVGKNQHGSLSGDINSDNVGELLKHWDLTDTMVGGKGGLQFSLTWPGPIYDPNLFEIKGRSFIHIANGRIINLDKSTENKLGFGRILGLLSLQTLPRRLTLDFSDLTDSGFAFDTLDGNLQLDNGNLKIEKIRLDGAVANIKASGRVGFKNKDFDIMLSAAPIITSSIPVAAALAGGPLVGVVSFVAEKIISAAIKKTVVYKYHVTGPWSKPDIAEVK